MQNIKRLARNNIQTGQPVETCALCTGIEGVSSSMVGQHKANVTGTVNIDGYVAWLKLNGYDLNLLKVQ